VASEIFTGLKDQIPKKHAKVGESPVFGKLSLNHLE